MTVIKHQFAEGFVKDAIVLDMGDLRRQADKLLDAARAQAREIVTQAQAQSAEKAKAAEHEAHARGHEQGLQQGLEQGRKTGHAEALAKSQAQLQQLQQGWLAAAQAWDEQRVQMDRDARAAVLRLGLLFAEKVVRRVIATDAAAVVEQVADALRYVMRPADVTVQINPEDRPILEEAMPQLQSGLANLTHVRLVDDAGVSRGGCRVSYGQGQIDATIETQLDRLVELLIPGDETAGGQPPSMQEIASASSLALGPPTDAAGEPEQAG